MLTKADSSHVLEQLQQKVKEMTSLVVEQRSERNRVFQKATKVVQEWMRISESLEWLEKYMIERALATGATMEEIEKIRAKSRIIGPALPVKNEMSTQKMESSQVSSETKGEIPPELSPEETDLSTGKMEFQLVISEEAGDARSCEEDTQGEVPALLQKIQSAVKKGKVRKKKKRWKRRKGLGTRQRKEAQQPKNKNQLKEGKGTEAEYAHQVLDIMHLRCKKVKMKSKKKACTSYNRWKCMDEEVNSKRPRLLMENESRSPRRSIDEWRARVVGQVFDTHQRIIQRRLLRYIEKKKGRTKMSGVNKSIEDLHKLADKNLYLVTSEGSGSIGLSCRTRVENLMEPIVISGGVASETAYWLSCTDKSVVGMVGKIREVSDGLKHGTFKDGEKRVKLQGIMDEKQPLPMKLSYVQKSGEESWSKCSKSALKMKEWMKYKFKQKFNKRGRISEIQIGMWIAVRISEKAKAKHKHVDGRKVLLIVTSIWRKARIENKHMKQKKHIKEMLSAAIVYGNLFSLGATELKKLLMEWMKRKEGQRTNPRTQGINALTLENHRLSSRVLHTIRVIYKMRKSNEKKRSKCSKGYLEIGLTCSEKWGSQRELKVWDPGLVSFKRKQWMHTVKEMITANAARKPKYLTLQRNEGCEHEISCEWDPGGAGSSQADMTERAGIDKGRGLLICSESQDLRWKTKCKRSDFLSVNYVIECSSLSQWNGNLKGILLWDHYQGTRPIRATNQDCRGDAWWVTLEATRVEKVEREISPRVQWQEQAKIISTPISNYIYLLEVVPGSGNMNIYLAELFQKLGVLLLQTADKFEEVCNGRSKDNERQRSLYKALLSEIENSSEHSHLSNSKQQDGAIYMAVPFAQELDLQDDKCSWTWRDATLNSHLASTLRTRLNSKGEVMIRVGIG